MASKPVKPLDWTHWRPEELVFYFAKESQLVVSKVYRDHDFGL